MTDEDREGTTLYTYGRLEVMDLVMIKEYLNIRTSSVGSATVATV